MNKIRVIFIVLFCMMFLFGCSKTANTQSQQDNEKKGNQQTSNEFITEINDAIIKGDYDKFNSLFSDSSKGKFTKEDFQRLKDIVDASDKSGYYVFSGKDNKMVSIKISIEKKDYIDAVTIIPEEISYYAKEALDPTTLTVSEPTHVDISNKLLETAFIYFPVWSPDETSVVFIRGTQFGNSMYDGRMYLWKTGEKNARLMDLPSDRICNFSWSPDSKYVIVDTGTYVTRVGYIVSTNNNKIIKQFGYVGPTCWSPDSKMFVTGVESDIKHGPEYDVITDLAVYNVETGKIEVIAKATKDTYLTADKWDSDGTITYSRYYYPNNEKKSFTYKYK